MDLGIGQSLGLGLSQSQRQELKQRLSLKQQISLYFGHFITTPRGICPNCGHKLSERQIKKGFSADPQEFRTTCPKCGHKFFANLIINHKNGSNRVENVYYICPIQTLNQMRQIKEKRGYLGITYLAKKNRQLFYNIIKHFGTYPLGLKALKNYREHP
ncbi:MAG: hypothetical protein NTX00_02490 [Candidatus Parcubacteria bacterium]|nr:hypothetical protein [Candidatus Parcubacteria bacterium]